MSTYCTRTGYYNMKILHLLRETIHYEREAATEEHHRLGHRSLWRKQDNWVKWQSITLIVIPEEFLPPLDIKGGDLHFFIITPTDGRPKTQYLVKK